MGLIFTASSGPQRFSKSLDPVDLDALAQEAGESTDLSKSLDVVFGGSGSEELRRVKAETLKEAVRLIKSARLRIKGPRVFQLATNFPPGFHSKGSGTVSGMIIGGVGTYAIKAGVETCDLVLMVLEGGKVVEKERRDLRGERKLVTDNMGEMGISYRRKPSDLSRFFTSFEKFLTPLKDDTELDVALA